MRRRPSPYSQLPSGTDVLVVGAGIVGLAVAREFARRGRGVVVVDADLPGFGTSSRGEGNLLVSDKEIPAEAHLAMRSLELWKELAAESEVDFEYEQKGGLVVATSPAALAALVRQAAAQARLGITCQILDAGGVAVAEPHLTPDVVGGLWYEADAQVQPILAVHALLQLATRAGVALVPRCEVTGLDRGHGGPTVRTTLGAIGADLVVNAAGPWSGEVAGRLGGNAPVFPRRGMLLVTEPLPVGAILHKVYDGGYVTAVASDEAAALTAPVLESTRAGTVLIGSSREAVGWERAVRWDLVGQLSRAAIALVPALASVSIIRTYQGFRPASPDHLPIIGPDPIVDGLFHATGHEGAGIGLAPATAEHLVDLVDAPLTSPFDPGRFQSGGATAAPLPAGDSSDDVLPPDVSTRLAPPPVPSPRRRLASALMAGGEVAWRRTRARGAPRGLFCGIGECFDCLVIDQDTGTARACLVGEGSGWQPHHLERLL